MCAIAFTEHQNKAALSIMEPYSRTAQVQNTETSALKSSGGKPKRISAGSLTIVDR
jgi:hypothetical protein